MEWDVCLEVVENRRRNEVVLVLPGVQAVFNRHIRQVTTSISPSTAARERSLKTGDGTGQRLLEKLWTYSRSAFDTQ